MRRSLIVAAGLVLLLALAAPAVGVTDGQVDVDEDYPFVALTHDFQFVCSAGAISDTVLITAAHCFELPEGETSKPVQVIFDLYAGPPTPGVWGTWTPDPDFCIGCEPGLKGFDTHDVAVIVLDEPFELDEYIALPEEGMSQDLKNHSPVTQVGYGVSGWTRGGGAPAPAAQPVLQIDFLRRYAPAEIITSNHVHADEFLKYTSNPGKGKGGICFGDSGGPNLYYDGDTPYMLSINSYGNQFCTGVSYSYRIDTEDALGFIEGVISPQ